MAVRKGAPWSTTCLLGDVRAMPRAFEVSLKLCLKDPYLARCMPPLMAGAHDVRPPCGRTGMLQATLEAG
jgi:hypothetical protein